MFMQQGGGGGGGGGGVAGGAIAAGASGRGGFNQNQNLHGPLAYLEKTATNIDLVGIGDGRR